MQSDKESCVAIDHWPAANFDQGQLYYGYEECDLFV